MWTSIGLKARSLKGQVAEADGFQAGQANITDLSTSTGPNQSTNDSMNDPKAMPLKCHAVN
eukprot:scaffold201320_cov36-Prasinocladus_malaysianus.AAC.1